jgi:AcrR family transcriptional regulator
MQQESQDTKGRLLHAATEVFAERGFAHATVREICRRAQANVAAVNYHFGDKKRLYSAIFDQVFATLHANRAPRLPRTAPPEQRLHAYLRSFLEELLNCDDNPANTTHLSAMYLMEIARPTEVLDHLVREYIAADARELQDIVQHLLGPAANPVTIANCAASVAGQALYYHHAQPLITRLHPELPDPEQRVDDLVAHVLEFSLGGIERVRRSLTALNSVPRTSAQRS